MLLGSPSSNVCVCVCWQCSCKRKQGAIVGVSSLRSVSHWWSPLRGHKARDWMRAIADSWRSPRVQYTLRVCVQAMADRRWRGLFKSVYYLPRHLTKPFNRPWTYPIEVFLQKRSTWLADNTVLGFSFIRFCCLGRTVPLVCELEDELSLWSEGRSSHFRIFANAFFNRISRPCLFTGCTVREKSKSWALVFLRSYPHGRRPPNSFLQHCIIMPTLLKKKKEKITTKTTSIKKIIE